MTFHPGKQAWKTGLLLLVVITQMVRATSAWADPGGPEILAQARDSIRLQNVSLTGQLRTGAARVPFQLVQEGGVTTYTFTEPAETVSVALGEDGVKISGVKDPSRAIRGSILTYDDLALRFLYWKKIEEVGTEKILSLPCWKLLLTAPDRSSPYALVKLWVNRQSGAFLRAQAFDWSGKLVKQFQVIATQTINGRYFLKQMRIQDLKPTDPAAETITYLEINKG